MIETVNTTGFTSKKRSDDVFQWYMDLLYEMFTSIVFPDIKNSDNVWGLPKSFFSALLATVSIIVVIGIEILFLFNKNLPQIPFPPQTILQLSLSVLLLALTFSMTLVVIGLWGFAARLYLYLRRLRKRKKPSHEVHPKKEKI